MDKDKEVAYYSALVQGWLNTRLEKDRSLLTLSAGGIGLLVAIFTTVGIKDGTLFVLFIFAVSSFIVALFSLINIFDRNAHYLENVKDGKAVEDVFLKSLDRVAEGAFFVGVILTFIIGISVVFNNMVIREKGDMMCNADKQVNVKSQEGKITESFSGVAAMKPVAGEGTVKPGSQSPNQGKVEGSSK